MGPDDHQHSVTAAHHDRREQGSHEAAAPYRFPPGTSPEGGL